MKHSIKVLHNNDNKINYSVSNITAFNKMSFNTSINTMLNDKGAQNHHQHKEKVNQ